MANLKVPHGVEILLARHSTAAAAKPGQSDSERELTPEGREKAVTVGEELLNRFGARELLIHSVQRAEETGVCMLQGTSYEMVFEPNLFFASNANDQKVLDDLFDRLKYNKLGVYAWHDAARSLQRLAEDAAEKIIEHIRMSGATKIMVAGHAIYTLAIALKLGETVWSPEVLAEQEAALLAAESMPECGAYLLTTEGGELLY